MDLNTRRIRTQLQGRLTPNEAARLLKISRSTIWRLMLRGKLPFFRIGSRRFIRPEDLARMIAPAPKRPHDRSPDAESELAAARVS